MADLRNHPEQDQEHEGASAGELLIEAARRNNVDLLKETIESIGDEDAVAKVLNETKTVLGNHIYHEAALRGNYEIIDTLLDQPGFECDPISRIEHDTPLHSAIRYLNTLTESSPLTPAISSFSTDLISMMIEAGSDPRIKNKASLTPADLADPRNVALREQLREAVERGEAEREEERDFGGGGGGGMNTEGFASVDGGDDAEDDGVGSGSDSDFDPEEYKREKERRDRARKEKAAAEVANGRGGMI